MTTPTSGPRPLSDVARAKPPQLNLGAVFLFESPFNHAGNVGTYFEPVVVWSKYDGRSRRITVKTLAGGAMMEVNPHFLHTFDPSDGELEAQARIVADLIRSRRLVL